MAGRLRGQSALVTGASSGIGAEIAKQLAGHGAALILVARRRERLEQLAETITRDHGVEVRVEAGDLSSAEGCLELLSRLEASGVEVDILVNNAGFGLHGSFLDNSWDTTSRMMDLNMTSLTLLTHALTPAMVARGRGVVMNVASIGAYMPVPGFAVYAATKAYVRNFSEALDEELRGTGVRVIAVCPGATRTEFMEVAGGGTLSRSGERMAMSAARCAEIAVTGMLAGRGTIVTGFINALAMWFTRFIPRRRQAWISKKMMDSSVSS